ncbi:MAG TPA: hypothetical protein VMP03_15630, partial [Methylomirabilota bacterium]|nr:hypothetical protein [Methylomirabilota bacterium]
MDYVAAAVADLQRAREREDVAARRLAVADARIEGPARGRRGRAVGADDALSTPAPALAGGIQGST